SGKSTVAQMFADLGAWVVDADAIAREVVAPGSEGLAELVEQFGSQILTDNGDLDRAAVAAVVFSDPSARERLNAIVHPLIARRTTELIAAIPQDAVLVHDVPLLVELGMQATYDLVVVVDAPDDVRVQRLVQRGLDEDDARARIAAQASRDERLAVADVIIENTGDLDDLRTQVKAAWPQVSGQP
ncbi:MAG TPA: dephospho-CoA kinase, partial [Actinomycetota bacterium]|nr:dephospho-CoA kinase [Actinomycetota bacterium]